VLLEAGREGGERKRGSWSKRSGSCASHLQLREGEARCGYPLTEAQPYLELKFTGSEGSGLHVVPLESIQERVHIIPHAPSEKKRFFCNHFKP